MALEINSHGRLLLTAEEAAEVLSVSRTTVFRLIGKGLLPVVQIGRLRRIPLDALREFARAR